LDRRGWDFLTGKIQSRLDRLLTLKIISEVHEFVRELPPSEKALNILFDAQTGEHSILKDIIEKDRAASAVSAGDMLRFMGEPKPAERQDIPARQKSGLDGGVDIDSLINAHDGNFYLPTASITPGDLPRDYSTAGGLREPRAKARMFAQSIEEIPH